MKIRTILCNCGGSLRNIDWKELERFVKEHDKDGMCDYMENACSKEGKQYLKETHLKEKPEAIVFASCTPKTAGYLFEDVLKEVKVSPFRIVGANLREHVSWVTLDKDEATEKAKALVLGAINKARHESEVPQNEMPMTKRVLVIGAGPTGMQAAQKLASIGIESVLIDRNPYMGGYAINTGFFYPTDDCSACLASEGIVGVHQSYIRRCQYRSAFDLHPMIDLMIRTEVEEVRGSPGNFTVTLRNKPTYVRMDRCILCDECTKACPVEKPNTINLGWTKRKAIYLPSIISSTTKYVVNRDECPEGCTECAKVCPANAIDLNQQEETQDINVGAVIVATGFREYDAKLIKEYHYFQKGYEYVITQTDLARTLDITGPTQGEFRKRNGDPINSIVFINCAGSRSTKYLSWCSNICCMISLKHAIKIKQNWPETDVTICYIDIRAVGPGYEDYYARARDLGVKFVRGRPGEIDSDGKNLYVMVEDSGTGEHKALKTDLVTLSMGMVPNDGVAELAKKLKIEVGQSGYFEMLYSKLRHTETKHAGIFAAGSAIFPSDIPMSITSAGAATMKVMELFGGEKTKRYKQFPVAEVNQEKCTLCEMCITACPYNAMKVVAVPNPGIKVQVNTATCMGCGHCASTCPVGAITIPYYDEEQILDQVRGVLYDAEDNPKPIILAITCWECAYGATDYAGQLALTRSDMKYPANVRIVPIECTGRISVRMIEKSFEYGADGVLIVGCLEDRCHYDMGSKAASVRVKLFKNMLEQMGIDPRRVDKVEIFTSNANKFVEKAKEMTQTLKEIGKLK
ncbi:MAG: hydrogenase iron-sulfur subunit [Candidatus Hermodarchaeota archaeon]